MISVPSRLKNLWSFTVIYTYKSPVDPPRTPASPSPATRIRFPVSTPAGILTSTLERTDLTPLPLQSLKKILKL